MKGQLSYNQQNQNWIYKTELEGVSDPNIVPINMWQKYIEPSIEKYLQKILNSAANFEKKIKEFPK